MVRLRPTQTFGNPLQGAASMADEITAGCGAAELRPTPGAPVIDNARLAHERLEPLRLAHRRVLGRPKPIGCLQKSSVGQTLIEIERSIGSTDVEIDKSK